MPNELYKNILSKGVNSYLIIFLYLFIHLCLRLIVSQTLQVDDREQIIIAQELLLGYPIPQPPLYSWLSWIFFKIFGINLLALSILKYSLIALTFYILFLATKEFFNDQINQNLALFAYFLMPSFFWHMHQGFTHTILLSLGIAASIHAVLILKKKDSYFYLGIAIGIGLMGKYSYLIFLSVMILAMLMIKDYRDLILNKKILITLVVALVIISPNTFWLIENYQNIFPTIDEKLNITNETISIFKTYQKLFLAYLGFIFPLIFIALVFFRSISLEKRSSKEKLMDYFFFVVIALSVTLPLFFSIETVRVRWLHPVLMLFPFWLMSLFKFNSKRSICINFFYISLTLLTILILVIRIFQGNLGANYGFYTRLSVPIVETINLIPEDLKKNKLIIADNLNLFAHLGVTLPNNKIIFADNMFNPEAKNNGCLLLSDNLKGLGATQKIFTFSRTYGEKNYEIFIEPKVSCQ